MIDEDILRINERLEFSDLSRTKLFLIDETDFHFFFVWFQISKKLQEFETKNGGSSGCKDLTGVEKLAKDELDAQVKTRN